MSRQSTLKMVRVSKRFPGTLAVDNVDFEARAGEVHALMGENGAGKSTLMKILAGSFTDYTGKILVNGKEALLNSPATAKKNGIGMIYQELSLARPISIAENLLACRLPTKFPGIVNKHSMLLEAGRCLQRVGLEIDPLLPVEEISQHAAQLVEIAKVLGSNPSILVMDEPTSALSREEVKKLFSIIDQLKQSGLTIIYISHHLPEIFRIADKITVLRDGKKVATKTIDEVTHEDLVRLMVGKTIAGFYGKKKKQEGGIILQAKRLTRRGFFHDISFHVHKGEILGIAGLSGSGRTELARSMCGLDPLDSGTVFLSGKPMPKGSFQKTAGKGLSYLSEDRKTDGLFLRLSVKQNLVSTILRMNSRSGFYSSKNDSTIAARLVEKLDIVTRDLETEVGNLSGGNQQKVLLGKWIAAEPKVLILDEPTRGVDIKAKKKIHETVMELACKGSTVILISSDLPELIALSDRVMIMRNGHVAGELKKEKLSEETVLLAINGHGKDLSDREDIDLYPGTPLEIK